MDKIKKRKSNAFGKDVYLLGRNKDGDYLWLEQARWDCGWYWGFGYIEIYTNNEYPHLARDINSHSHWNSTIVGQQEIRDIKTGETSKGDYYHHFNENPNHVETVLTDKESWELAELMKSFYTLSETASFFHEGKSNVAETKVCFKDRAIFDKINKEILPKIFERIYEILTP